MSNFDPVPAEQDLALAKWRLASLRAELKANLLVQSIINGKDDRQGEVPKIESFDEAVVAKVEKDAKDKAPKSLGTFGGVVQALRQELRVIEIPRLPVVPALPVVHLHHHWHEHTHHGPAVELPASIAPDEAGLLRRHGPRRPAAGPRALP